MLFNEPRRMKYLLLLIALGLAAAFPRPVAAQAYEGISIQSLSHYLPGTVQGRVEYVGNDTFTGTNGVIIQYHHEATLEAERATVNTRSGEVEADGRVRIEADGMVWAGEHVTYNFKTHHLETSEFRTGKLPVLVGAEGLVGENTGPTNHYYLATNAVVTTDDVADPLYQVRARRILVVPGQYVAMWNAVFYVGGLPVFYYPYYERSLHAHQNHFTLKPGFRSMYGPYLLGTYAWFADQVADGKVHTDYRYKRGPGVGPDVNLHLGQWGDYQFKYYYVNDNDANYSTNLLPVAVNIPRNRQRFEMQGQATPYTNLNVKAQVNYQSDPLMLHDYFQGDYGADPQPQTFVEADRTWDNWSLDVLASPEVDNFFDQVERLPDVRLTGFTQPVYSTPFYYDSQTSLGYYEKFYADTNAVGSPVLANTNYAAMRFDTYQQVSLPWTFGDWLNVAPRVGGRITYYGDSDSPVHEFNQTWRKVFNTGARASFKVSRLWADATNSFLQVDGLRHVMEPSADYVYVPNPSAPPAQLPQFDFEQPGLLLSPIEFPDYSSIDSVDSQNVIRFGLRNTLQTKRGGQIEDLVDWNLLLDWRLRPNQGQSTFNDLYSDLTLKPRNWLGVQEQFRYDPNTGKFNMAFHQIQFTPGNRFSWGIGYWYLRPGFPTPTDLGDNYVTSTMFYRLDDNWGLRLGHDFNAHNGRLQEQDYTVYRDMRAWTAALTFHVADNTVGPVDYGVSFSFSFKAEPSQHVGDDAVRPDHLLSE